ncbi:MAG: single-stranded-DNA-specific exonuclease RecJ [Ruminococcaceae bacterium]|nr:single-stranded-DNA-specific exonuclease RecJ [Oscillospiraceae bacterium]
MKNKKWELRSCNFKNDPAGCNLLNLAQIVLLARGMKNREQVMEFLRTDLSMLLDPFLIPDMDKAVCEIEDALANNKKIAVYGDYDVDGVTATCAIVKYLESQNARYEYYIPDRISEGYGLNMQAIDTLRNNGVDLLVTVDSGITAIEETAYARSLGMHVVITDHHECKEELPDAEAVVNPRRLDSNYPFKELAGVGVAFKLLCALERDNKTIEEMMMLYGDIVAIGTIADVMPLVSENRAIVANGLKLLEKTKNKGLYALMKKLNIYGKTITASNVSFMMAPRINAAGRLGGAATSARMLLTDDEREAAELADLLCDMNAQRQEAENDIYKEITARMESEFDKENDKAIVLWGEDWHNGVIGIVASRLAEKYSAPTVLISLDNESGKGSGRSIKGFNLYQALEKNSEFLEKYGGHEMAVGLTIAKDKLYEFRRALNEYCIQVINEEDIVPTIIVDCEITPEMLSMSQVKSLETLEPFGMENPQPIFVIRNMRIQELTPIGKDKHVKLKVERDGKEFYALGFGLPTIGCQFTEGDTVDIVCSADINEFRGNRSVQLVIKDIKFSESELITDRKYMNIYNGYISNKIASPNDAKLMLPTRDDVVSVFRHLKCKIVKAEIDISVRYRKVRYEAKNNMNLAKFLICLDMMQEFGILSYELSGNMAKIQMNDIAGKVDLNKSLILQDLCRLSKGK